MMMLMVTDIAAVGGTPLALSDTRLQHRLTTQKYNAGGDPSKVTQSQFTSDASRAALGREVDADEGNERGVCVFVNV